eukprot:10354285-Lingulodinium_polyedra.AAC.1
MAHIIELGRHIAAKNRIDPTILVNVAAHKQVQTDNGNAVVQIGCNVRQPTTPCIIAGVV